MEREFEKKLDIIKQRNILEQNVYDEKASKTSTDESIKEKQKELDDYNDKYKEEIQEYNNYYSILSKKVADRIDAMPIDTWSSYIELTKQALLEMYSQKMFTIFNKVIENIDKKDYYLDYSKYDELDVGLPYSLEFIKLNRFNKVFDDEIANDNVELSYIDKHIIQKMTEVIDNLPLGTTNTFIKVFEDNIINILDLDMNYLTSQIYDCLKYRDYCLDYMSRYGKEEYKWFANNKPYLTFTKINDPDNNYATKNKEIDKIKADFEKSEKEAEKYKERLSTMSQEEIKKEMDKGLKEMEKLIDDFKKSDNIFLKDQSVPEKDKIDVDEVIKRIDDKIAELNKKEEE